MPRPRNIQQMIHLHLTLPASLVARIYANFASSLDGKVPQGMQQKFFIAAAEDYLDKLERVTGS